MCVILVAQTTRPTDEMIERAWDSNPHGGGVAWREGEKVHWQKGLMKFDDMKELVKRVPMPFVAHFRVASVGGKLPALTHPFLVDPTASLALEGSTKGAVLFHNGHWHDWNEKALDAAIASNSKVPVGAWSDTRAIAWLVHIYGGGFFELLTKQKGVIFTTKNIQVFTGDDGWRRVNDVWCSNDLFWTKNRNYSQNRSSNTGKTCIRGKCQNTTYSTSGVCCSCEQKDKDAARTENDKEDHSTDSGGGVPSNRQTKDKLAAKHVGKLQLVLGDPLVDMLTLDQAKRLHAMKNVRGERLMSKKKFKEYQERWEQMLTDKHKNRQERARRRLVFISEQVAEIIDLNSLSGTIH